MTAVANRDAAAVAGAAARVWLGTREVVGGAFLVGPDRVATCARVVADALGTDPASPAPPTGAVWLDFPLVRNGSGARLSARVERWTPPRADGTGDGALLRLTAPAPAGVRMPPLRRADSLVRRGFSVLGFPAGLIDGVWSTGEFQPVGGNGRLGLLRSAPGEQPVSARFAGTPVWDTAAGAVIGMTVPGPPGHPARLMPIAEVLGFDPESLPSPYRGLRAFDEAQAGRFFGRDADIERLVAASRRLPVVAVAGPSGAGKSSLLRAGLVPRLRAEGTRIIELRALPGVRPDEVLAFASGAGPTLLVVDQFEELASVDPRAARALLDRIVRLTGNGRVRAALTLRWAALDELLTPELAGTLEAGTLLLAPLDRDQLRQAIVRPADQPPGLGFEEGLVERLLDDAGTEPGQLPLVAALLADLWERREGGYLTLDAYRAAGGVAGAVAQHAERVIARLPEPARAEVRRLCTALARPDQLLHGDRFARRAVPLNQLPPAQNELVPGLARDRLLVVGGPPGGELVELAHQALIDHWPRLRDWLAEDRDFLSWREQLGANRQRWEAASKEHGALLRGTALATATEWLSARRADLTPADLDYVRRSTARQRREVRRWRVVAAALAVLSLGAAVLGTVTVYNSNQIATRLAAANADSIGRAALARLPDDPVAGTQLALAAYRSDPRNPRARTALARAYLAMRSVDAVLPNLTSAPIDSAPVRGDIALVQAGTDLGVLSGVNGTAPRYRQVTNLPKSKLAVSPDGRELVGVAPDGAILAYELTNPEAPARPLPGPGVGPPDTVFGLRYSPDGQRLAALVRDAPGQLRLVIKDMRTGELVAHGLGPLAEADRPDVQLTLDPKVAGVRTRPTPDRPADRQTLRSLVDGSDLGEQPKLAVVSGSRLLTCDPDSSGPNATNIFATSVIGSPDPPRRIGLRGGSCYSVVLSSDQGWLISTRNTLDGDHGSVITLTNLQTGEVRETTLPHLRPTSLGLTSTAAFADLRVPGVVTVDGRPSLLLGVGTSVLRLSTEPSVGADQLGQGDYLDTTANLRVNRSGSDLTVRDRATGRELGAVHDLPPRTTVAGFDGARVWTVTGQQDRTVEATAYALPELRPVSRFRLPARSPDLPPPSAPSRGFVLDVQSEADGGRLLALNDGVLTAWDPATGKPDGAPVPLEPAGPTNAPAGITPQIWARPGHPGQVAVLTRDMSVQVWNVPEGRKLATLPAEINPELARKGADVAVFDRSGDRLAVLTKDRAVRLWNVDDTVPAGPPIPAPNAGELAGFDPDGYLVVFGNELGMYNSVTFLDLDTGGEAGSIDPPMKPGRMTGEGRTLVLELGLDEQRLEVPLSASAWRDKLCAVADRPFTPAETKVLPPGADTDPPCQ
ncbi:hypothetical protein GCM10023321_37920 [Pseudonocardia eucalypti]|uniref:Novel STAND NTPase 1 domain-containing protein n=1 Tax=Pseudonocardia eucalypti TaxID=648755 RepID=A0ABP9Q7Y8_9PSEU